MIVEYIRYTLTSHEPNEFLDAYADAACHLATAPECLNYELAQCSDDSRSFILRIQWVSAEAHLREFRSGPHFPPFLAAIRRFVPEIAEMRHYVVVPLGIGKQESST